MFETVILVIVGVVCGTVLGFWLGRVSARYYVGDVEEKQVENTSEDIQKEERNGESNGNSRDSRLRLLEHQENRRAGSPEKNRLWYEKRELDRGGVYPIGSPISGVVTDYAEGKHPEVMLYPMEEKVYAPAGGKVIRLFPLGNEMLFRTEEGAVLRMKVGADADELQSEYFHLKVIQNEVVNKGKLLLEFDKNTLEKEGVECNVLVSVEEVGLGDKVLNVANGRVKSGEEIFEISRM